MHSDQTRKYGISESIIQALIMTLLPTMVCIMDSEMPYVLVWSLCIKRLEHHAVYCIILVLSLVLLMQSLYIIYTLSNLLHFSFTCNIYDHNNEILMIIDMHILYNTSCMLNISYSLNSYCHLRHYSLYIIRFLTSLTRTACYLTLIIQTFRNLYNIYNLKVPKILIFQIHVSSVS